MTLIYKKKIENKEEVIDKSNYSIIINSVNKEIIKNNWFKGSRDRGLR